VHRVQLLCRACHSRKTRQEQQPQRLD
jgi:hypothetical protein